MMDVTDAHWRYLARLLTRRTTLYTEMQVDKKMTRAPPERVRRAVASLRGDPALVLQLGGSDPAELGEAVRVAANPELAGVNLNCGCPSARVSDRGQFGAVLMLRPGLVAECAARMREAAPDGVPVTVKCRVGVDASRLPDAPRSRESYEDLAEFVRVVSSRGGVSHFVVHARKAILGGALRRTRHQHSVPPLRRDMVARLAADFPALRFTLNGGVASLDEAADELAGGVYHGVMMGRALEKEPFLLAEADARVFGGDEAAAGRMPPSRLDALRAYAEYAEEQRLSGRHGISVLVRPVLPLFNGTRAARPYRRALSEAVRREGRGGSPARAVDAAVSHLRSLGVAL